MATNTITGTLFDDVLATTAASDKLTALAGNDIVLVALAADYVAAETLDGGAGYDQLWYGDSGTLTLLMGTLPGIESVGIADAAGNTNDTIASSVNAGALAAVITGFTLFGNDGANSLTGTLGKDLIIGNGGLDTISGGAGNDRIVTTVITTAVGVDSDAMDQISAAAGAAENNTLVLAGLVDSDPLVLDDYVAVDLSAVGDQATVFLRNGADTVSGAQAGLAQTGFASVDASGLVHASLHATASAQKNFLVGGDGNDVFLYSVSAHMTGDVVSGGTGNDVIRFTSTIAGASLALLPTGVFVEEVQIADAAGATTGTTLLNLNGATLTRGIVLTGNDGANALTGGLGNDTINGNGSSTVVGAAADVLKGGVGNDLYVVDDEADSVLKDLISDTGGLDDRIAFTSTMAGAELVLGPGIKGVEKVYLSDVDFDLTDSYTLKVDASAMLAGLGLTFFGNAGHNEFLGGKGNDTFVFKVDEGDKDFIDAGNASTGEANTLKLTGTAASPVMITLNVAANADQVIGLLNDTSVQSDFRNVDAKDLSSNGVVVVVSALGNKIIGSSSVDIIAVERNTNLSSADSIDGGGGNDILRFAYVPTTLAGATMLTVGPANLLDVETVDIADLTGDFSGTVGLGINAGTAIKGVHFKGNYGANKITGGLGADTIDGSQGADTLIGGAGDDAIDVEFGVDHTALDSISGGTGTADVLRFITAAPDTLVLNKYMAGIESVRITDKDSNIDDLVAANIDGTSAPGALQLFGNYGPNALTGSKFGDRIEGDQGLDTIFGGLGNDTIAMSAAPGDTDVISAAAGAKSTSDKNLLELVGEWLGFDYIYIDLGSVVDQMPDNPFTIGIDNPGAQTGFWNVDASKMTGPAPGFGINVLGTTLAEFLKGSTRWDVIEGAGGADTLDGAGAGDAYIIRNTSVLTSLTINDNGGTTGDSLVFEIAGSSATIKIQSSWKLGGIDGADVGFSALNMSLDASGLLDRAFSLSGNAGNNNLTGTDFGESIFDPGGGNDIMRGRGGSDDYVIQSVWQAGDKVDDAGLFGRDDLYYTESGAGVMLVTNTNVIGIERFIVSSAALNEEGPNPPLGDGYIRDIRSVNDGTGFDLTAYGAVGKTYHLAGDYGANELRGTNQVDTILGWRGNDTIIGNGGADWIWIGASDASMDVVNGSTVGALPAAWRAEQNLLFVHDTMPGIMVIDLSSDTDQITVVDRFIDEGVFTSEVDDSGRIQTGFMSVNASGVLPEENHPAGRPIGVVVIGSAGSNTIVGSSFDDVFVVKTKAEHETGNDSISGGGGNDVLRFDVAIAGEILQLSTARLASIERVEMADADGDHSSTMSGGINASSMPGGLKLAGNDGANTITGTGAADIITGNGGADSLVGGLGNDLYVVNNDGADAAGDTISDTGGTADRLRFASNDTADGGNVLLVNANMAGLEFVEITDDKGNIDGDPGADTPIPPINLDIDASAAPNKLDIRGNDAVNSLAGSAFADTITGNHDHDTIDGNGGGDFIVIEMPGENPGNYLLMDTFDQIDAGAIAEGNTLQLIGRLLADNDTNAGGMTWDLSNGVDQLTSVVGAADFGSVIGITHLDASLLLHAQVVVTGSAEGNRIIGTELNDFFYTATPFVAGDSIDGGADHDELHFISTNDGDTLVLGGRLANVEFVNMVGTANLNLNAAGITSALKIDGNDGSNSILGGSGADTIAVEVSADDTVSGGALAEGNFLILTGAAAAPISIDLSQAGDQETSGAADYRGFKGVDASAVTGNDVNVIGSTGNDRIGVNVGQGSAVSGNLGIDTLILGGAGPVVIDLSAADQVSSMANTQSGFENVDAFGLGASGMMLTGSSGANLIVGSLYADTINSGAGADTISAFLNGVFDDIDAGAPGEGNLIVLAGDAAAIFHVDLTVAPGGDQLTDDAANTQTGFQHVDASAMGAFGLDAHGNALNNSLTGSMLADTLLGGGGADRIVLGGGKDGDNANDVVVYERPSDGIGNLGAASSVDHIVDFESGVDKISFAADFHDGVFNLDDIDHNNSFKFVNSAKVNFSKTDEGLLITGDKSGLTTEASLTSSGFGSVATAINKMGVVSAMGDDGLILVQASGGTATVPIERTGIYYYVESDGIANKVSAGELTLLGIVEAKITESDVNFI